VHPLWFFWLVLEEGLPQSNVPTHNAGHLFIGGHMSGGFSPNDPVFWFHHANVDRIWANWQANRLTAVPGSNPEDHWPSPADLSPFDGRPAPLGHRLNDAMWPWIGSATGFDFVIPPAARPLVPSFTSEVKVKDVLDTEVMGYRYAPPAGP
jgi:tyrosinase